jgi:hypothetical protein
MTNSFAAALAHLTSTEAPPELPLTERFKTFLDHARPGEVYTYATTHVLDTKTPPETQAVALLAREAFARGEIELD